MANNHQILRRYRERTGIALSDLAARIGVSPVTLRSLENGSRAITPHRAVLIERETGGAVTREALLPEIFGRPQRKARA